jgi:hypothetical protein
MGRGREALVMQFHRSLWECWLLWQVVWKPAEGSEVRGPLMWLVFWKNYFCCCVDSMMWEKTRKESIIIVQGELFVSWTRGSKMAQLPHTLFFFCLLTLVSLLLAIVANSWLLLTFPALSWVLWALSVPLVSLLSNSSAVRDCWAPSSYWLISFSRASTAFPTSSAEFSHDESFANDRFSLQESSVEQDGLD